MTAPKNKMIKKVSFYNIYESLNSSDFMFNNINASIGDNLLLPLVKLKERAKHKGIDIGTICKIPFQEADAIVFIDYPKKRKDILKNALSYGVPVYLMAVESEIISPEGQNKAYHKNFAKVFTWNDSLVKDNPDKYIKLNYAFDLPQDLTKAHEIDKKLCTMISANKNINAKGELYSKRLEIINTFEKIKSNDFDFYGYDWNYHSFAINGMLRYLNKFNFIRSAYPKNYQNYKGSVIRKKHTLAKYNFAFCYENFSHPHGYITEKIFDAFLSDCIPIYLGAKNIHDHIPTDCFVDASLFESTIDIYKYIKGMNKNEILKRKDAIKNFIGSNLSREFSIDKYTDTILKNILN